MAPSITPITSDDAEQTHTRLTIEPMLEPKDGSVWAFNGTGYTKIVEPWTNEAHIGPIKRTEKLGDVESWADYVKEFGGEVHGSEGGDNILLTWTDKGLLAILDYHFTDGTPGRCAWVAEHPFLRTRQWLAWEALANGRPRSQRELIEALEDRREDVRDPDGATLLDMLKKLRGTVNAQAQATLESNGNTKLEYTRQTQTSLTLPQTITIGIPVLRGHAEMRPAVRREERDGETVTVPVLGPDGMPVLVLTQVPYELEVRIRVDVLDEGKIAFRMTMPNAEQALEDAVADRVAAARELLGDGYRLLRATA